jgi:hypothetical protein
VMRDDVPLPIAASASPGDFLAAWVDRHGDTLMAWYRLVATRPSSEQEMWLARGQPLLHYDVAVARQRVVECRKQYQARLAELAKQAAALKEQEQQRLWPRATRRLQQWRLDAEPGSIPSDWTPLAFTPAQLARQQASVGVSGCYADLPDPAEPQCRECFLFRPCVEQWDAREHPDIPAPCFASSARPRPAVTRSCSASWTSSRRSSG